MAKIQMPDDFYVQTPDGNVLATEAVMNTIRTADMLFDQIGRLLRPLHVSAAGGLVLGHPARPWPHVALGARGSDDRDACDGHRRGRLARAARVRQPLAQCADRRSLVVEITPSGLRVVQQLRTLIHGHERAWMSVFSDAELRGYVDLLHRIQAQLEAEPAG